MKRKFGIRAFVLTLLAVFLTVLTVGCAEEYALESEFDASSEVSPANCAAFRSAKNVFDVSDVTMEFGFGTFRTGNNVNAPEGSRLQIRIEFQSETVEAVALKTISSEEFFTEDKYRPVYDKKKKKWTFDNMEVYTVPEKFFSEDKGWVSFCVVELYTSPEGEKIETATSSATIYYTKEGDQVTVYDSYIKWRDHWDKNWRRRCG